jgi:hypothetical protein
MTNEMHDENVVLETACRVAIMPNGESSLRSRAEYVRPTLKQLPGDIPSNLISWKPESQAEHGGPPIPDTF